MRNCDAALHRVHPAARAATPTAATPLVLLSQLCSTVAVSQGHTCGVCMFMHPVCALDPQMVVLCIHETACWWCFAARRGALQFPMSSGLHGDVCRKSRPCTSLLFLWWCYETACSAMWNSNAALKQQAFFRMGPFSSCQGVTAAGLPRYKARSVRDSLAVPALLKMLYA